MQELTTIFKEKDLDRDWRYKIRDLQEETARFVACAIEQPLIYKKGDMLCQRLPRPVPVLCDRC